MVQASGSLSDRDTLIVTATSGADSIHVSTTGAGSVTIQGASGARITATGITILKLVAGAGADRVLIDDLAGSGVKTGFG